MISFKVEVNSIKIVQNVLEPAICDSLNNCSKIVPSRSCCMSRNFFIYPVLFTINEHQKLHFFSKPHFLSFLLVFRLQTIKKKVNENEFYLLGPIFGPKIKDLSIEINQNFFQVFFAHHLVNDKLLYGNTRAKISKQKIFQASKIILNIQLVPDNLLRCCNNCFHICWLNMDQKYQSLYIS